MKLTILTLLCTMTILASAAVHADPCPIYNGAPGINGYDEHPNPNERDYWDPQSHVAGWGLPGHNAEAPYDGGTGGKGGTGYHTYSGNGGAGGNFTWGSGLFPGEGGEPGDLYWDLKKTQSSGK